MFDIAKADARTQAIYAKLSAQDKILVDEGVSDIEDFAGVIAPAAIKPPVSAPAQQAAPAEPEASSSLLGTMVDAAQGTAQEFYGQLNRFVGEEGSTGRGGKPVVGPLAGENFIATGKGLEEKARANQEAVRGYRAEEGLGEGWEGGLKGMAINAAENPDSLAGLAGGILSKTGVGTLPGEALIAIPTSRVFLNKYYQLIDQGVPKEEAKARAAADAAIEFGTEQIPFGVVGKTAKPLVTGTASKIVKAIAAEAGEEALAEIGQDGLDNIVDYFNLGSEALQKTSKENEFKFTDENGNFSLADPASRISYAATLGGLMGGALRGSTAPFETNAEVKSFTERTADMLARGRAASELQYKMHEGTLPQIEGKAELFQDVTPEVKSLDRKQQEDIAYKQKEAQDASLKEQGFEIADAKKVGKAFLAEKFAEAGIANPLVKPEGEMIHPDKSLMDEAALARKVGEAEKVKREEAKKQKLAVATTAARKAHVAGREAESLRLRTEMVDKNLPDDHYVSGMKKWNQENKIPTEQELLAKMDELEAAKKAPKKPKAKRGTAKAKKVEALTNAMRSLKSEDLSSEDTLASVEDTTSKMKQVAAKQTADKQIAGKLPQVKLGGPKNPTRSLQKTLQLQTPHMQPREMNAVEEAAKTGKLVILGSDVKFGTGETLGSASGKYDGKTMYINQDKLDSGTKLMDVVNHEVDHYYKHADSVDKEDVKRLFVGKSGVEETIAKIEGLAKNKHPVAVKAKKHAEEVTHGDPSLYKEELVSYFHQHAQEASRKKMLGSARSALADLKSQLRDTAIGSKVLGKLNEVEDTGYVSRKRLENIKHVEKKSDEAVSRESVGGERATGFAEAQGKDRVWTGTDGKKRFWFSDDSAKFNTDAWAGLKQADPRKSAAQADSVPLVQILDHPELYKQYPHLRYVPVYKYHKDDDTGGYMMPGADKSEDAIWLNTKFHGETKASARKNLLTMLHENQHIIQREEDFAGGTNSDAQTKKVKEKAISDILSSVRDPMNLLALQDAVATAHGYDDFQEMEDSVNMTEDDGAYHPNETTVRILQQVEAKRYTDRREAIILLLQMKNVRHKLYASMFKKQVEDYQSAAKQGIQNYYDHSGEREARMVEDIHNDEPATRGLTPKQYYKDFVQGPGEIIGELGSMEPASPTSSAEKATKENATHEVYDTQTGKVVDYATSLKSALRKVDNRDNKFGGTRFAQRQVQRQSLESRDIAEEPSQNRALATQLWEGIKALTTTSANYGRIVRESVENAGAIPAEYQLIAEAGFNDLTSALEEATIENPEYNWKAFWEKLDEEKDGAQRDRMVNAMAREFPEVARSYRMFRDLIDNFTDLIVMERAKTLDTNPLTPEEANMYSKLLENKGRYTTRAYLLSKGKSGKMYGKESWKSFVRGNKEDDESNISENDKRAWQRVSNAIQFMERQLVIPENLPTNRDNLEDLYSAWFVHHGGETADEMRDKLTELRGNLTKEKIEANSIRVVRAILGVDEARAGTYAARVAGMDRDNTIMTARKEVPQALRELMGEVKEDVPLKLMMTLTAQANYVARTRFLAEIATHPELVVKAEDRLDPGNEKFTVPLMSKQWGPLEGYYATPLAGDLLEEHQTVNGSFANALKMVSRNPKLAGEGMGVAVWNAWGSAANFTKGVKIIGNPINYVFNVGGNVFNLTRAGNVNPKYMVRATKVARELIGSKSLKDVSPDTRKMLRTGMTDSAQIGELKVEALDILRDAVMKETNPDSKVYAAKQRLRSAAGLAREIYAMTDIVSKMANYMYYEDQLREFYELNEEEVSEEQLEREVSDYIKDENVTFLRAAPWLKVLESRGLTRFATYIGETFRTQLWNVLHGIKELERAKSATTPAARMKMMEIALRRIVGSAASISAVTAGLAALASMGDDDEDKGWKKFLADYAKIGAPIILGRNKEGHPLVLTLSRFDPVGPIVDILRAAQNGEVKDIDDVIAVIKDLYIAPTLAADMMKYMGSNTQKDKDKYFDKMWQAFLPAGFVNLFLYDYPQGTSARALWGNAVRLIGGRLEETDPEKTIGFAVMDFKQIQKTGRADIYDSLADGDLDKTIDYLAKYQQKEDKAFRELAELDRGLVQIGKTPRQRRTMLKDAGLSEMAAEMIIRGKNLEGNKTFLLNWDSVKAHAKESKRDNPLDYPEVKSNILALKARLKKLGYKFKE